MSRKQSKPYSFLLSGALVLAFAGPSFADDSAPAPGPALDARQKLLERIQQARSQGMGITGYMQAFQALEQQVKAGDSEDKISSRVQSIHKAVTDQMERARILKTQRPLPPQGSQVTGSDPIAPQSPSGGKAPAAPPGGQGGPGGGGDMISKLKDKFGDKLNALPDGLKERLMNNPDAQSKIMEKIKERGMGGDMGGPPAGGPPAGGPPGGPPPGGAQNGAPGGRAPAGGPPTD